MRALGCVFLWLVALSISGWAWAQEDGSAGASASGSGAHQDGSVNQENPKYRVPQSPPLYRKDDAAYGAFLKFPSHFALGAQVAVGRLESPGRTRGSGPARSISVSGMYHLQLPSMNGLMLGLEYATSSLKFSTGKMDVPVTFSVKSGYSIKVTDALKKSITLALGRSYGHYYETLGTQDIRSDGLVSGTVVRVSADLTLAAYEFVSLNTGIGYALYEYAIQKTVKQGKAPEESRHQRHRAENLMLQVPYLSVGVSAQI